MSAMPLRKGSEDTGTSVIPFPIRPYRESDTRSRDPGLADRLPSLQEVTAEVKSVIESFVTEAYFKQWLNSQRLPDDPFDAIYLSRLQPDAVDHGILVKYLKIQDRSHEISFKDALGD